MALKFSLLKGRKTELVKSAFCGAILCLYIPPVVVQMALGASPLFS